VVGAEEVSLRIEAGTATIEGIKNRDAPNASHTSGIGSTRFCKR
jgi:hypothetical protein